MHPCALKERELIKFFNRLVDNKSKKVINKERLNRFL